MNCYYIKRGEFYLYLKDKMVRFVGDVAYPVSLEFKLPVQQAAN